MKRFWILKALMIIPIVAAFMVLFTGVVMLLWNALMPDIFGLPIITFWQAAGLLILSKILFGGFRKGGHWGKHHHGNGDHGWKGKWKSNWKAKWEEKWSSLPPDEQERMRERFRQKCGMKNWPPPGTPGTETDQSTPTE